MRNLVRSEQIERAILLIRGQKVMLDYDLAKLYGVETKILNQAVKRNIKRFPGDFMFQLDIQEVRDSRSQIVTLDRKSTRLNSSHSQISYAVFCLKKNNK